MGWKARLCLQNDIGPGSGLDSPKHGSPHGLESPFVSAE